MKFIVKLNGMMCAGCENRVKGMVSRLFKTTDASASHETGEVVFSTDMEISDTEVKTAIEDMGYDFISITRE